MVKRLVIICSITGAIVAAYFFAFMGSMVLAFDPPTSYKAFKSHTSEWKMIAKQVRPAGSVSIQKQAATYSSTYEEYAVEMSFNDVRAEMMELCPKPDWRVKINENEEFQTTCEIPFSVPSLLPNKARQLMGAYKEITVLRGRISHGQDEKAIAGTEDKWTTIIVETNEPDNP